MEATGALRREGGIGILTIGNEVLDGIVMDTNSNWIEGQLRELGIQTKRLVAVRDEIDEIVSAIGFLSNVCDVVFTVGGLGPTHDDKTLAGVAAATGLRLVEDAGAASIVKRQYRVLFERGIVDSPEYTPTRQKMAIIPEGAIPLDNTVGGAPGVLLEHKGISIVCLPGVPSELKQIFTTSVRPWLENRYPRVYYERIVEFPIHDETVFASYISKVMQQLPPVYIKSMAKTYGTSNVLRVWVYARASSLDEARRVVEHAILRLEEASGLHVISSSDCISGDR